MTPSTDNAAVNGDRGWRGVNMRLDPSQLGPGWMSGAINARFRDGVPETRLGSIIPTWLNKITGGLVGPWTVLYGQGEFRDPTTFTEYVLLAVDGGVVACVENNAPIDIPLPAGEVITERCTFLQAFNVVLLLRGFNADALVMENINQGFHAVIPSDAGTGVLDIPRALRGLFAANRVFLMREDDTVVASDILDYTHYSILNDFRVNQGDADRGVGLVSFGRTSIIVFKERSVYRIDNVFGLLDEIDFSQVTDRYGCVSADSIVNCGSDVLWLSEEGVASLTLTEQNEIQAAQGALAGKNRMFSEDVGPLIERVNGRYIQNAFAALWSDRYYLALPIDMAEVTGPELMTGQQSLPSGVFEVLGLVVGQTYRWTPGPYGDGIFSTLECGSLTTTVGQVFTATAPSAIITVSETDSWYVTDSFRRVLVGVNNALAHYDFQNVAWGGYDEAELITFRQVFTAMSVGRRRLFVIDHAGYVRMWEEDYADRLAEPYVDIEVIAQPISGNYLQVNGGTIITADDDSDVNYLSNRWGCLTQGLAAANLWGLDQATGFSPAAPTSWTDVDGLRRWQLIDTSDGIVPTGVRFTAASTLGAEITVVVNGDWARVTHHAEQDVVTTLITRGYRREDDELTGPGRVNLDVKTWDPRTSLTLLSDGVNEDIVLFADRTRDRTAYYRPFNRPPYDEENVNDDFSVPHRQDYSIEPTDADFEFEPPADSPVSGDLHQSARYPAKIPGPYRRVVRFEIVNTQGRLRLDGLDLEYTRGRRNMAITN